jgi:DNA polymerase-3 subunit beta
MKFKVERKRLYDACRKVIRATASAKNTPELTGILLEADGRTLRLTATDLTVTMMMKLKDVDIRESGRIVIPAVFTEMLGAMTGDTAEVTVRDSVVRLQCGAGFPIFRAPAMNAEQFPNVGIAFPETTICVQGIALIARQGAFVASERHDNPSFQGVQMRFAPDITTAASSDGIRFVRTKGDRIADGSLDLFIPERALKILCGIVRAGDELFIGAANNCAVFMTNELVFTARLTNGDLSNVESVIEKIVPAYSADVDSKAFAQAVDSCILMTQNADQCVNITLTGNSLMLTVDNENGSIEIEIEIEAETQSSSDINDSVFHYRPNFICEFLRSCTGAITLEFSDKGVMRMRSALSEYVVTPRKAAVIKEIKKGKAVKTAA